MVYLRGDNLSFTSNIQDIIKRIAAQKAAQAAQDAKIAQAAQDVKAAQAAQEEQAAQVEEITQPEQTIKNVSVSNVYLHPFLKYGLLRRK
jgi:hypothetical protein